MTRWLQAILCIGVISLSAASSAYTWKIWDDYERREAAYAVCEKYLNINSQEEVSNDNALIWRRDTK